MVAFLSWKLCQIASPCCSKPSTDYLTLFQMCVSQHQMLSTCIPCPELLLRADSHTGTLCGETIHQLSVFLPYRAPRWSNCFQESPPLLMRAHRRERKKMSRKRGSVEEGKSSECVAKWEIKTRGRKVGRTGRENVALWHKTAHCSRGLLQFGFLTLRLLNTKQAQHIVWTWCCLHLAGSLPQND